MNASDATDILGNNHPRWEIQHMARALGLHSWLNTPEENLRREASAWALRHWSAYQAECSRRRDRRSTR